MFTWAVVEPPPPLIATVPEGHCMANEFVEPARTVPLDVTY
jgi:hypothetical protein